MTTRRTDREMSAAEVDAAFERIVPELHRIVQGVMDDRDRAALAQ